MSKTTVELLLTRVEVLERAVERLERRSIPRLHLAELLDRLERRIKEMEYKLPIRIGQAECRIWALEQRLTAQAEYLSAMASNRFLARIETSAAE